MPHPQMFDDDDPSLARVREIALAFPAAEMKVSHGRPAFFTAPRGKVFVYYGGSHKLDGDWVSHEQCVMVLLEADEREALLDDPRAFVPAYLGPSGWLGVDLPDPAGDTGWDEVAELVDASYRRTAAARLVAELDAAVE
ncbi:MmcQ/YjbR family DNA-binding protein [soil metagenome]